MRYFEKYIKKALEMFYKNDRYLIEHRIHEQTMTARIAHYLTQIIDGNRGFREVMIDCEYNKNIDDPKYFGELSKKYRPDIIAHKRGTNNKNKFVIEMKKRGCRHDKQKIRSYVNHPIIGYEEGYALQKIKKNSFYIFFYERGASKGEDLTFKVTDAGEIERV